MPPSNAQALVRRRTQARCIPAARPEKHPRQHGLEATQTAHKLAEQTAHKQLTHSRNKQPISNSHTRGTSGVSGPAHPHGPLHRSAPGPPCLQQGLGSQALETNCADEARRWLRHMLPPNRFRLAPHRACPTAAACTGRAKSCSTACQAASGACIPILAHLKAAAQRRHPVTNSSGGACSARCTKSGRSCRGLAAMHSNHSHAGQTGACTSGGRRGVQACDVAAPAGLAAKQRQLQRAQARSLRGAAAPLAAAALVACLVRQYRRAQCIYCARTSASSSTLRLRGPVMVPSWCATATAMISSAQQGEAGQRSSGWPTIGRAGRMHACMHMHAAATGMQHQRRSEAQRPVRQHAAATRASPAWVHRGRHFLIKPTL